jgi:peptidyl-prolyl cis-trans isomerase SurA
MNRKVTIVFFFILVIVLQNAYAAVLLDRIVAVVNNEVITWSELRNIIAHEGKNFLEKAPENQKEDIMKELEKSFLNSLIDLKIQLQEARRKGLDVSAAEINGAIADIKNKYNITDEKLMNSLEAEGMSMAAYRTMLGEQILLSKVINFEVKANIVINDREIGDYYEANKDKLGSSRGKIKIRQIFFTLPKDSSQKPSVEAKAHEVIQRLERGEDFSKLAGELSEDANKQFGGDLGYISRGSALKEVEDVAFALKPGEVSKPFWSPAGLHIIKLEDKIAAEGLDKVKDKIKEILFENAFESKYHEWKTGLKERAYIEMKL